MSLFIINHTNEKENDFLQKKRTEPEVSEISIPIKLNITKKIKLGPWNKDEDKILLKWVEDNGPHHWGECAKIIKDRTGKQCRERWKNCLVSGIRKGEWTPEENLLVLKLYEKFKSYKKMIPAFPGRTENSLKNRFFIQLRKTAIKNNKQNVSKIKLEELKSYLKETIENAEEIYFKKNKKATKENLEEYLTEIENSINNSEKGKSIYLSDLRDKIINKNYDSDSFDIEDEDEQEMKEPKQKKQKDKKPKEVNGNNKYNKRKKSKIKKKKSSKKKNSKSKNDELKQNSISVNQKSKSKIFSQRSINYNSRYSSRNGSSKGSSVPICFMKSGSFFLSKNSGSNNINSYNSNNFKGSGNLNNSSYLYKGSSSYISPFFSGN
jgi:hypothetical protein